MGINREIEVYINISNSVTGIVERRIEVTPITNQWLLAKERTWEEVDTILEGRLHDLQDAFQDPQHTPIHVTKSYGIERPVSGGMARLLAYAELFDEYAQVESGYKGKANALRTSFEEEKTKIKMSDLTPNKRGRRIEELGKNTYNTPIVDAMSQYEEAKGIQELILRKAVLDIFSIPHIDASIPFPLIEMLPQLIQDQPLIEVPGNRNKHALPQLLDGLTHYLTTTKDQGLYRRYAYRKSPGLIRNAADCDILARSLALLQPLETTETNQPAQQLDTLGKAYFSFLTRRSMRMSPQPPTYPMLSLINDTYTAAFFTAKETMIQQVDTVIGKWLGDSRRSSQILREIDVLQETRLDALIPLLLEFRAIPDLFRTEDTVYLRKHTPDAFKTHITGIEERLLSGITELCQLGRVRPDLLAKRGQQLLEEVVKRSEIGERKGMKTVPVRLGLPAGEAAALFVGVENLVSFPYLHEQGVEADLALYAFQVVRQKNHEPDRQRKAREIPALDILRNIYDEQRKHPDFVANFLHNYILFGLGEDERSTKEIERENEFLWKGILDTSLWFVSPRGDKFTQTSDPQLTDLLIDSLTFHVDSKKPREHTVQVRFSTIDHPFTLWLDTKRTLRGAEHELLPFAPDHQQKLANILLKRLYAITSGLLSTDSILPDNQDDTIARRDLMVKRAHYRVYTSKPRKVITMESLGAHKHAEAIRSDYGIDIYQEMRRRRGIGALAAQQYLTFVREHVAPGISALLLPNILSFDPTIVQFPIS